MSGGSDYQYIYYLNHQDVVSAQEIRFYDANLRLIFTVRPLPEIEAFSMDYENGIYSPPTWLFSGYVWSNSIYHYNFFKTYAAGVALPAGNRSGRSLIEVFTTANGSLGGAPSGPSNGLSFIRGGAFLERVDVKSTGRAVEVTRYIPSENPFTGGHTVHVGWSFPVEIETYVPEQTWVGYGDPAHNPQNPMQLILDTSRYYYQDPQEALAEISVADYWINVTDSDLTIDWDRATFHLHESLFPQQFTVDSPDVLPPARDPLADLVVASFDFLFSSVPVTNASAMLDGAADTQTQMVFYAPPVPGTIFSIIDLGAEETVDAVDVLAGYFTPPNDPTGQKKFDFSAKISLKYSLDGVSYYPLTSASLALDFKTGTTWTAEKDALGSTFSMRYLKIEIDSIDKVAYQNGAWPISIANVNIYQGILPVGEATLQTTVTDPETQILDADGLVAKIGDRLYKVTEPEASLETQEAVNQRAMDLLTEFVKNHHRIRARLAFHPGLKIGDTVPLNDPSNGISRRYFIEEISNTSGGLELSLAYYP